MSVDETPEKDPQLETPDENSEVKTETTPEITEEVASGDVVEAVEAETTDEPITEVLEEGSAEESTTIEEEESTKESDKEETVETEATEDAPASLESLQALATSDEPTAVVEGTSEAEDSAGITVVPPPVKVPEPVSKTKWYSLRVISGKERKIKERIDLEVDRSKWRAGVVQILVPTEKVYKIKGGKKVIQERNILPGYILVEGDPEFFTSEMVSAITGIPNVIHFLGRNNPIPMRQSEANKLLGKVDESNEIGESMVEPFIVGETVKIIDGAFVDFVGDIQEVNEEKKKLKVIVKIFGRGTEVELNFIQVEKQQ